LSKQVVEEGMHAIALGTAGGPVWWGRDDIDAGISTAIVVDGKVYLVDFGYGAGRQLRRAGHRFGDVEALFITHMHSDHTVDLASLFLFARNEIGDRQVKILGPGNRGKLPPLTPLAKEVPTPVNPESPVPGITETLDRLVRTYSADINDRIFDYGSPSPATKFDIKDIALPAGLPFDPNENVAPEMEPFVIFRDERVSVSAILVDHHPTAPAYAFRFDSRYGSIVVSGDTGYCQNLITISQDCDVLFHEAINLEVVGQQALNTYPDPEVRESVMSHHRRSHTTALDAGRIASMANVGTLVLHHLVPANAPLESWQEAAKEYDGRLIIAHDLDTISLKTSDESIPTS